MGGGFGNRIARLKHAKQVVGLFGNTIRATHKLILPSENARVYGEARKEGSLTLIDFNTVVPKHSWA